MEQQNQAGQDQQRSDIGALWRRQGKKGEYLVGKVKVGDQDLQIICFPNVKNKEAQPDYRIFKSLPPEER